MQLNRDTHLDGLRGLAALIVVIVHGIIAFDFALYSGLAKHSVVGWDELVSGAPFLIPMAGDFSVCVFFALSGYVLSQSFTNTRLGAFSLVVKRYIRFTPSILVTCLISYALLANGLMKNASLASVSKSTWLGEQMQQTPSLVNALREGLYGGLILRVDSSAYNSSLWTMCIEFWGSVILIGVFSVTALYRSRPELRSRARIIVLCILGLLGSGSYLALFAFGALLNLTQIHRKVSSSAAAILLTVGIFFGTIPYSALPWSIVRPFVGQALPILSGTPFVHSSISLCHSLGAVLLLIGANAYIPFRRMLSTPPFRFFGQISFPLYLIHIPLLTSVVSASGLAILNSGFSYASTMMMSLVIFVAISTGAATALLFLSERPSIVLSTKVASMTDMFVQRCFNGGMPGSRVPAKVSALAPLD